MVQNLNQEQLNKIIFGNGFISCADVHEGSCEYHGIQRFIQLMKSIYKPYAVIYIIPLILKRKQLKKSPKTVLLRAFIGFLRSFMFMVIYQTFISYLFCKYKNYKQSLVGFVLSAIGSILWLIETEKRQYQINLYLLPRVFESIFYLMKRRNYFKDIQNGGQLAFAFSIAFLNYFYQNKRDHFQKNFFKFVQICWKDI